MTNSVIYNGILIFIFVVALITFAVLMKIPAWYGRYQKEKKGFALPKTIGWVVMESPTLFAFLAFFLMGNNSGQPMSLIFLGIWLSHYLYRTLIYPFLLVNSKGSVVPIEMVLSGFIFNIINAYLNALWISNYGQYTLSWLADPRFIFGMVIFLLGAIINRQADFTLIRLRKTGTTTYQIPYGGMYQWITCPNYFGEILIWLGWAIATWSLAGLSFFLFTVANLLPRSLAHHQWYKNKFEEYPQNRKAIIPFIL